MVFNVSSLVVHLIRTYSLTFHRTLADLISLEQLLGLMMKKELLSDEVIHHLWVVFGMCT